MRGRPCGVGFVELTMKDEGDQNRIEYSEIEIQDPVKKDLEFHRKEVVRV